MSESEVTETVETIDTTEETPEVVEKSSPEQLPDDHPLVRALASQKALNKELKAKAAKLDEIENAQKTELQKAIERAEAAEKRASEAEVTAAGMKRTQYGMDKGLPRDLAELLTAADDEGLDAQIQKLLPHVTPKAPEPKVAKGDLRSGVTGSGGSTADPKERAANAIRQLFDR